MATLLLEKVEMLRAILIAKATGCTTSDQAYQEICEELLSSEIGEYLPLFVKHFHNLEDN